MAILEFKMNKIVIFCIVMLVGLMCFAQRPKLSTQVKGLNFEDSTRITTLFFAGLRQKTIQNFQQSANNFKEILAIDPENDPALHELANIYYLQNLNTEAERLAKQAISLKPENEWYWVLLGDIYQKSNNFPRLTEVFDSLIKIAPKKEDYYYNKAAALLAQNKVEDALLVYTEIEKKYGLSDELLNVRQQIYQRQGKIAGAAGELEKLVQSKPTDASNYLELSQVHLNASDKDKALQMLLAAKKADQTSALVSIKLAELYRSLAMNEEAAAELKSAFQNPAMEVEVKIRALMLIYVQSDPKSKEQAVELAAILVRVHPSSSKVHAVYGDILLQINKLLEAQNAYKKSLALNDQDYLIWENLLRIELNESDFDAAIKDGEEALTLFPSQAVIYLYTGMAYMEKKNYEKAVSYLKNAASLETEDKERQVQIYTGLGDAYNGIKYYKESDLAYEKALQLMPENVFTLNNFAYNLALRGENLLKAEQMAWRLNELENDSPSFQDTYAWVMFKQKKFKEARTLIEKALKAGNSSGIQLEHYGDILANLGETDLAVQQWIKARSAGLKSEKLERKINEKKYIE
jgi:tetratricopeptide (TPR) repeat protein